MKAIEKQENKEIKQEEVVDLLTEINNLLNISQTLGQVPVAGAIQQYNHGSAIMNLDMTIQNLIKYNQQEKQGGDDISTDKTS